MRIPSLIKGPVRRKGERERKSLKVASLSLTLAENSHFWPSHASRDAALIGSQLVLADTGQGEDVGVLIQDGERIVVCPRVLQLCGGGGIGGAVEGDVFS